MDSSVGKGLEYIVRGLLTRGRAGGGFRGGRATAGSPRPREMQARVSGVERGNEILLDTDRHCAGLQPRRFGATEEKIKENNFNFTHVF